MSLNIVDNFFTPCHDGNCIIQKPAGMVTNGGCRHHKQFYRLSPDQLRVLLAAALQDRRDLLAGRADEVKVKQQGRMERYLERIRQEQEPE